MIRRERGKFVLTCDTCGQFRRDQVWRPNKEAWEEAETEGWVSRPIKEGRDFVHACPDCAKATGTKPE